jgi:STE24 endopeptidase
MSEVTATRIKGLPSRSATLARWGSLGLAAALVVSLWLFAAHLLWRTSVPGDLRLRHLDPQKYFTTAQLRRTAHFDEFLRLEWILGTLTQLVVLAALTFLGRRLTRAFELGRVATGIMVGLAATTILWLVGLPFGLADLWWHRRYGIERQSYGSWLLEQWSSLLGGVVGLTILLTFLLLVAGWFSRRWWLVAGPALVAAGIGIVFVVPVFAGLGTHPVRDRALAAGIRELARKEGVPKTKVRVEEVSSDTRAINAEAIGFGPTTIVILWDTLLDGRFSKGEIEVVAAHELGHVAHRHIWKGIGWSALFMLPLTYVLAAATRRRGGMAQPEVVPFALLVLALLSLAVTPLGNVISRRYEAEADWSALQATRDPNSARAVFKEFTATDLSQPRPPAWSYVLLDDHPTVIQRIAMVEAWRAAQPNVSVASAPRR